MASAHKEHRQSSLFHLVKDYQTARGWDELFTREGNVRPAWQKIFAHLEEIGPRQLEKHLGECQLLLRESGVTHNLYGNDKTPSRPWELDLLPYVITDGDWLGLEAGIAQRLRLLGQVLSDLLGPQKLLREGHLPPELIFSHPAWSPAWVGIPLPTTMPLTFVAMDIARGDDGEFHHLADFTDTPSGIGYALENRLILSRVLPEPFRLFNIRRLLPFFRSFRNNLDALATNNREAPLVALLTSGVNHETHFEQAFLANYLGLTLVQGEDLTVRGGRLSLKTLDGLRPVDVILRRVGGGEVDPLEFSGECCQGVPGLLHAIRRGALASANVPGVGLLENQGLIPYLPQLCQTLLGEALRLPSVPTWWCGDPHQRGYVADHLENMVIKPLRPHPAHPPRFGASLSREQKKRLLAHIECNPWSFVGQEQFSPATTPVYTQKGFQPHPMVVRTFITADDQGVEVMPGGLARFSTRSADTEEKYGISKGVWILSDTPVTWTPRFRSPRPIETPALLGELPSRVAENLFWIGRHAERAEYTIRIIRVILMLLQQESGLSDEQRQYCLHALLTSFARITGTAPEILDEHNPNRFDHPEMAMLAAILEADRPGSVSHALRALVQSAQGVRERLSLDTWQVIQEIINGINQLQEIRHQKLPLSHLLRKTDDFIVKLMAFSGQTMESMTRGQGWRLLNSGRRLERSIFTVGLLEGTLARYSDEAYESALVESLLTITDSLITFRRRYRSRLDVQPFLELLLLDESNPRALAFQITALDEHSAHLPQSRNLPSHRSPEGRITMELLSGLRLADSELLALVDPENGHRPNLEKLLNTIRNLLPLYSVTLSNSYFQHTQPRKQWAPTL